MKKPPKMNSPFIVSLMGQKGGAGKSTIAISMAVEAMAKGHTVLLIDADPQGTARTWADVAIEQKQSFIPTVISMGASMHEPGQLEKLVSTYDFVVIDCPGRLDSVQRSALMVSDLALVPCGPTAVQIWAVSASVELIESAKQKIPHLQAALLINQKKSRTVIGENVREAISTLGIPVLRTELTDRLAYAESLGAGQGVTNYAPKSPGALEMQSLFKEILTYRRNNHE